MSPRTAAVRDTDDYSFITIVTFGRSGSTALQAAVNAHPGTIVRGENYAALRGIQQYVQAVAAAADRHHAGKPHHPWFGTARLDSAAVLADQRRHVVEYLLRPKSDTAWLGFKEVRYEIGHISDPDQLTDHLLFLNELLPGLRYVINTRDPQYAARSGWWRDHPDAISALEASESNLRAAHAELASILGPGRAVHLDYETWREDPEVVGHALQEIGFPANQAAITETLATALQHGKHPDNQREQDRST